MTGMSADVHGRVKEDRTISPLIRMALETAAAEASAADMDAFASAAGEVTLATEAGMSVRGGSAGSDLGRKNSGRVFVRLKSA